MIPFYNTVIGPDSIVGDYDSLQLSIKGRHVTFKLTIPSAMYFFRNGDDIWYCLNEELLASYILSNNLSTLSINSQWKWYMNMDHKWEGYLIHNKYNEIGFISMYTSIQCNNYRWKYRYHKDLFTIPIRMAGSIICNWIKRYRSISSSVKVADLSSGLDTRSLSYFWRDKSYMDLYTKDDPDEIPIVKELVYKHFSNFTLHIGDMPDGIRWKGKGADIFAVESRYLSYQYLATSIALSQSNGLINHINPYLDIDILKIKPDYPGQLKDTIQVLLASDLMDIPYKSFRREPYIFDESKLTNAYSIINSWNLNEII